MVLRFEIVFSSSEGVYFAVYSRSPPAGVCNRYLCCNLQDKHKQASPYLKPQPVPPSTMAATRMAPAMEPMIRLVALGPVVEGQHGKIYIFHLTITQTISIDVN